MPTVSSGGVGIACQQLGNGPDLIFIHGLGANRAFWQGVMAGLFESFRVTLFDLRGHGYSDMPARGYNPAAMAEDLRALMEALDCRRALLIGHSYGGQVALQFAALYPEQVAGLVVLDARINCLQPALRLRDSEHLTHLERTLMVKTQSQIDWHNAEDIGVRFLEEAARHQTLIPAREIPPDGEPLPFGGARGSPRMAQRWLRLLETTTAREDFTAEEPLREDLRRLPHPVLLAYGERSRCLASMRGLSQTLPRARGVVVPRAGHFFPLNRPRIVQRMVRAFASRLAAGTIRSGDSA